MSARSLSIARICVEHHQHPEPMRSSLIAFAQFREGLTIERSCPFCRVLIRVRALKFGAWKTECDCSRCNDTLKGT